MYKGRKILLGITVLVTITVITIFAVGGSAEAVRDTNVRYFPDKGINVIANAEAPTYWLSVHEGFLTVFCDGDVVYMSDIKADSLRRMDREMLESGIKANSYEEILQLLEDFGS